MQVGKQITMASQRRKFTNGQKRDILYQAGEHGVNKILREHNISYSVFARWKQQNLIDSDTKDEVLESRIEDLLKENMRLKKIIANLVLDIEIKNEELRKR